MSKIKGLTIKNQTATSADLYFYGDIVTDYWGAWQNEDQYPDAVKNFLSEQEGKDLNIYINSGGGSVFGGIAIYNMIKRHAAKNQVNVYVDGLAGSISSVLAFAGSGKPNIPANAFIMIHNPWTYCEGNAADFLKMADNLDQTKLGILNIYAEHLKEGVTTQQVSDLMDEETWLNGQQAAEYFDIEVIEAKEYAAAVGGYKDRCKNIPDKLSFKDQEATKNKEQAEDQEAAESQEPDAAADDEKRNLIKVSIIKGMMKGE